MKPQMRSRDGPQRSSRTRARPSSTSQVPLGSSGPTAPAWPPRIIITMVIAMRSAKRRTMFISGTFRWLGLGASVQLRHQRVGALVDAGVGSRERSDTGLDVVGAGVLLGDVGADQARGRGVE